ncbi:MAG TPA: type III pantothenate kinase [Candidimonas sp.]|nr:type III pantothenate kinase [Candidimonas sp.]
MRILIDAGNTRIKIGWVDTDSGRREEQVLALAHNEIGSLPAWLAQLSSRPTAALGVNVASAAIATSLDALFERQLSIRIRWIRSERQAMDVVNAYVDAQQLGADRWVSMVGLASHCHAPAVLASFGTATTVDTLGPAHHGLRRFEGGLIFPGPALMYSSLAAGTANLPHANAAPTDYPIHTHQAIASGIAAAQAGAVVRQWRIGLDHFGAPPAVFGTGGGWHMAEIETQRLLARAQADLGLPATAIQWLATPVLDGLARIASTPG